MIKIVNIQTNQIYEVYSIRFYASGNNIKGVLDSSGQNPLPPDGNYKVPDFNDTIIQINSYDAMMKNLGIDYHKDNALDFAVVIPR